MAELTEVVIFLVVGFVVGAAILLIISQSRVNRKAQAIYEQKRVELERQHDETRRLADSMYEQRKNELEADLERRRVELDDNVRNQFSSQFDTWKAEYVVQHGNEVEERIKAEVTRSVNSSRSALKGKINEQIAPLFPEFASKYVAADARFIGSPIDFIVFKNLHSLSSGSANEPQPVEIVFVEIKTGKPTLNQNEKAVKVAIENLRVKYDLLKISLDEEPPSIAPALPARDSKQPVQGSSGV